MKTIHLLRHAKSSWANLSLDDINRPLNKRGINSCKLMAQHLAKERGVFTDIYCSTAMRAQLTIEHISRHLNQEKIRWQLDGKLYSFDHKELIRWCQALDNRQHEVTLIGHNPALTDLCNVLASADLENLPTCGYARLSCAIDSWQELSPNCAEMTQFLIPKMFK